MCILFGRTFAIHMLVLIIIIIDERTDARQLDSASECTLENIKAQKMKIRKWLTPPSDKYEPDYFKDDFENACKDRTLGTCEWLIKHHHYLRWKERASKTNFAWLSGNPGTEKPLQFREQF